MQMRNKGLLRNIVLIFFAISTLGTIEWRAFGETPAPLPSGAGSPLPSGIDNPPLGSEVQNTEFLRSEKKLSQEGSSSSAKKMREEMSYLSNEMPSPTTDIPLFRWAMDQQISIEWGKGFLKEPDQRAPSLINKEINDTFLKDALLFFNVQKNLLYFPYIFKWGARASLGLARNYDLEKTYFIPLSLSTVLTFQMIRQQFVFPFVEIGFSKWNIDFNSEEFSGWISYWSVGALISFSILKPSLSYTLLDEYKLNDWGLIVEFKSHYDAENNRKYFLRTLHIGSYFNF